MKRAAYICSWLMLALTFLIGVGSYIVAVSPSSGMWAIPAVVFGVTLAAFHIKQSRWISVVAVALNAILALAGCLLIGMGLDFSAGFSAFLVAVGLAALLCLPSVLNVVALMPYVRRVNVVPAS
jgi:hypothetical protein